MDTEEQNAYQLMRQAVDTLATGTGVIQERLRDAFTMFHTLRVEEFEDEELKGLFEGIMKSFHVVDIAPSDVGIAEASVKKMSPDDCVKVANDIWRMYSILLEKWAKH